MTVYRSAALVQIPFWVAQLVAAALGPTAKASGMANPDSPRTAVSEHSPARSAVARAYLSGIIPPEITGRSQGWRVEATEPIIAKAQFSPRLTSRVVGPVSASGTFLDPVLTMKPDFNDLISGRIVDSIQRKFLTAFFRLPEAEEELAL